MPTTYCCVPLCKNKGGHQFPKNIILRQKWIAAVRRDKWHPSKYSLVCYAHFKPNDYVQETVRGGNEPLVKRLRHNAVPTIFAWSKEESFNVEQRRLRVLEREKSRTLNLSSKCNKGPKRLESTTSIETELFGEDSNIGYNIEVATCSTKSYKDQSVQTEDVCVRSYCLTKQSSTQCEPYCSFSLENYVNDPGKVHFYTGLENYKKTVFAFSTLGPAVHCLNYIYGSPPLHINSINSFFMMLIILRQHKTYYEVSDLFKCTVKDVHNIFITWVKFTALQWREINLWTDKSMVRFYSPSDFKAKYPTTRVILDATECQIKKPSMPTAQQATFSTYKNCNTIKVVVGTTPRGLITYVSPSFSGSTSDRHIIERSSLFEQCDSGDSIMVDKGFNVQDLFAPYNITVNIPTFFKKGSRIQASTIDKDRKIARKRVHVERSIGLIKTYKILKGPLNATQTILSGEIFFICSMLCNFRRNIVSKDA